MDPEILAEKNTEDYTKPLPNENSLDNLVNFSQRASKKLRKIWKENYHIDESKLTTLVSLEVPKERAIDRKEIRRLVRDLSKKKKDEARRRAKFISEFKTNKIEIMDK